MLGATQSWEEGKTTGLCVKQSWPKKKYSIPNGLPKQWGEQATYNVKKT